MLINLQKRFDTISSKSHKPLIYIMVSGILQCKKEGVLIIKHKLNLSFGNMWMRRRLCRACLWRYASEWAYVLHEKCGLISRP